MGPEPQVGDARRGEATRSTLGPGGACSAGGSDPGGVRTRVGPPSRRAEVEGLEGSPRGSGRREDDRPTRTVLGVGEWDWR